MYHISTSGLAEVEITAPPKKLMATPYILASPKVVRDTGPPICAAGSTPRQLSTGKWICEGTLTPGTPGSPAPTSAPESQPPAPTGTSAAADEVPAPLMTLVGPAMPEPEKKKVPTWAWAFIGAGGLLVVGVGGYFAYKAGKGS